MTSPKQILGFWWEGSLSHPVIITALYLNKPEGYQEPCKEVGYQNLPSGI